MMSVLGAPDMEGRALGVGLVMEVMAITVMIMMMMVPVSKKVMMAIPIIVVITPGMTTAQFRF